MIKTTAMIKSELHEYSSPADKLSRLVKSGAYTPIIKGLYESDRSTLGYLIAESIYGPSYLSFEFALSHHGLIPEAVYTFTSATFEKKKKKKYVTAFGTFTYWDVPSNVYAYGVNIVREGDYCYKIATAEKTLCDQFYKMNTVSNYKELKELLFDDLLIDEQRFEELHADVISELALRYRNQNVKKLSDMLRRR